MNMANERVRYAQIELLVAFMERHGDIQRLDKQESNKRWIELVYLLNDKSLGEPKPMDKWRKCWSDYKNNVKKKVRKISRNEVRVNLSKLEKRILKIIANQKGSKKKFIEMDNMETVIEENPCEVPPSPTYCFLRDVVFETTERRKSSASSSASVSSNDEAATSVKRETSFKDNIKDVADKYLEFEREREKLAHEREMARIRQNDQLVTIFGRIVNVLETLTPCIQKYLDRDINDDR